VDHTEGAGIFISGPDTHNVRVWGTHFGTGYFGEKEGNKVGIHLNDGAHSNIIGMRGSPYRPEYPVIAPDRNFHNTFSGSTHAAILIEDSGGFSGGTTTGNQPPPEPTGANVMINNIIGRALLEPQAIVEPNEVGILLTGDSFANRIGGFDISEQNEIRGCNRAGIELRGISPPIPGLSNRIIGNYITANGGFLDPVDDILAEEFPVGAGILLSEGSSGNIVGGLGAGDKNNISLNIAGIWVEGDENSDAEANNYFQGMYLANSRQAGIVLRNSHGNQIGPYLEVNRNGRLPNTYGGIVLYNSDSNRIVGNWVGTDKSESLIYDLPNRFSGVQLIHSSSNIVGGVHTDRNKILGNLENGILIEGSGSSRNRIYNNNIGVFNDRNRVKKGNPVAGIAFEDGAHDNQVGGVLSGIDPNGLPWNAELPNLIIGNGAGILNNGNGTSGNTFVRNVITQNNGKGIQNINNGNEELPPPLITSASGSLISGTVDPAYIPDGSFVEVFSDGDDEGDQYIGTGIVKDGEFSVKPLAIFGTKVNATVTNFLSGSTSEFGGSSFSIMGFRVSRRHDIPPTTKDIPNNGWSLLASVEFTSVGLPAMVEEIKFRARGSANESSAISTLRVLQDVDGDGQVSASDIILEEGLTFSEDDGELIVEAKMHVPSDSRQTLLLEGMLNGSAAGTQTLIFEVEDANKVKTVGSPVPYPIAESGAFPISSDTLVLFEGTASKSGFSEFMDTVYPGETDPSKIGPNEDPDKDGRSNLREYAEGTHPGVADEPHPFTVQQDFNSLIVTFTERAGITDLKRDLEFSTEPNGWTTANGRILSSTTTLLDNGLLQVSMVIDISDLQVSDIYLRLNRTRLP